MYLAVSGLCGRMQDLHCITASGCDTWALEHAGPVVAVCGPGCSVAYGATNFPNPPIRDRTPALQGRFLTTGPPEKSLRILLNPVFQKGINK